MPYPKTGRTHYHAQLGLLYKGRAIKEFVVCYVLLYLIPRVFGQEKRDLITLSYPRLLVLPLKCHGQHSRQYEVIVSYVNQNFNITTKIENYIYWFFL